MLLPQTTDTAATRLLMRPHQTATHPNCPPIRATIPAGILAPAATRLPFISKKLFRRRPAALVSASHLHGLTCCVTSVNNEPASAIQQSKPAPWNNVTGTDNATSRMIHTSICSLRSSAGLGKQISQQLAAIGLCLILSASPALPLSAAVAATSPLHYDQAHHAVLR